MGPAVGGERAESRPIVVIGATGMLGRPVAQQLVRDGFAVRVLARSPEKARSLLGAGVEIVRGDVFDPPALRAALSGAAGVHISLKGGPSAAEFERMDHLATREVARAAVELGVERVSLLSAYAVSPEKADTPESRSKALGEADLRASGAAYTIFRCSWFMESLPLFVQGGSLSLIGKQVHPLHWIAASDYARMVANSYRTREVNNKELYIFGPEAYTMAEAMEMYAGLARPKLKVAPISTGMLALMGTVTFNAEWKSMATLMRHYERWGEDGSPEEANRLLGAPETTLRAWCASFRPPAGGG